MHRLAHELNVALARDGYGRRDLASLHPAVPCLAYAPLLGAWGRVVRRSLLSDRCSRSIDLHNHFPLSCGPAVFLHLNALSD